MEQERPREVYRECMRNHAAKLGTYAADGCCEYTPDDDRPGALLCAACGCHRNFHRKALLDVAPAPNSLALPGAGIGGGEGGHGGRRRTRTKFTDEQKERMARFAERLGWRMPKREPGRAPGDDEVARFCREIGVTRQVFKVWMHNHKGGGGSGAVGGGAATSSSTTRGGGGGGGGGRSPALPGEADTDVEDEEEEVKGNEMCM